MKSAVLRTTLAAAAVAAGALAVAQPASAQQAWVQVQVASPAVVAPGFVRDHDRDRDHDRRDWHRGDRRGPDVLDVSPDAGQAVSDRGFTRISARYSDNRSGVAAVSLRVDGRDVTHRARVESDEIHYRENLVPGRHYAELFVRDRAGNVTRRSWNFDVVDTGYYGYWNPGSYRR
jgi:hypothetical protein